MNDSDFIELLNLYLDHEISPADAARLEAEVLHNPARRQVYRQYCQMQKACKVLAVDFQMEEASADRKIVAFETAARPAQRTNFYTVGALAAVAACLAVVFVSRSRDQSPAASQLNQEVASVSAPQPAVETRVVVPRMQLNTERTFGTTVTTVTRDDRQPKLASGLSLVGNSSQVPDPLLMASGQTGAQFAWMLSPNLQLAPVQRVSIDQFRFDARSAAQTQPPSTSNRQAAQNGMEWNAIKYQK